MAELTVDFKGLNEMQQKLTNLAINFGAAADEALRAEAEIEMTEAKKRCPVWNPERPVPAGHTPGQLRASGRVEGPSADGKDRSVRMVFGGGDIDYAVYVHEDLEAFHASGQAKFLESTLLESAPHMPNRVAARMKRTLGS
jgi:hypothetical protein